MEKQTYEMFVQLVTRLVIEELEKLQRSVPIGVSNRHIHLDRKEHLNRNAHRLCPSGRQVIDCFCQPIGSCGSCMA